MSRFNYSPKISRMFRYARHVDLSATEIVAAALRREGRSANNQPTTGSIGSHLRLMAVVMARSILASQRAECSCRHHAGVMAFSAIYSSISRIRLQWKLTFSRRHRSRQLSVSRHLDGQTCFPVHLLPANHLHFFLNQPPSCYKA